MEGLKQCNRMAPRISVVLPAFNAEKYLREAIDSILSQTFVDFELIVINDGSTDKTQQILDEFKARDSRVVLISRENRGLVASLNEGVSVASGIWIARMDADDISHPERFAKQVALIESADADICGCHWLVVNQDGKTIDANITPLLPESFVAYLSYTVPFAHGSVMMRKSFLVKNSLKYDKVKFAEDYDLWIRMFEAGAKFANVDEFLFKYRDAPATLSKNKHKENVADTKRLRRRFVKNNTEECLQAARNLSRNYNSLNIVEKIYVLFLSFHVSLISNRIILLQAFSAAPWKFKLIGIFRILRG